MCCCPVPSSSAVRKIGRACAVGCVFHLLPRRGIIYGLSAAAVCCVVGGRGVCRHVVRLSVCICLGSRRVTPCMCVVSRAV
jgi:hypothetical protein